MKIRGFEVVSKFEGQGINIPERKTAKSAGYDIEAGESVTIPPLTTIVVPTGLKAYMQDDEVLNLHVRSSIGIKRGLKLANITGIIDADYYNNPDNEGHIMLAFWNPDPSKVVTIAKNECVAQGIFGKFLTTDNDNASGDRLGGIGSTTEKGKV